jgi:hypothetical protein
MALCLPVGMAWDILELWDLETLDLEIWALET